MYVVVGAMISICAGNTHSAHGNILASRPAKRQINEQKNVQNVVFSKYDKLIDAASILDDSMLHFDLR